jgi:hemolysin III
MRPRFREPVAGLTHLFTALAILPATAWLVVRTAGDGPRLATMLIYSACVFTLFMSSAVMHLYNGPDRTVRWLVRIDHAAIYLLTAGTYTPVCYNLFSEPWRTAMLAAVWLLAALGVTYKLAIGPKYKHNHISTLLYIGLGWLAVLALPEILRTMPGEAFRLFAAGGMIYTGGAFIFMFDDPDVRPVFGIHELWHLFVMAAAALHYAAIALYIA